MIIILLLVGVFGAVALQFNPDLIMQTLELAITVVGFLVSLVMSPFNILIDNFFPTVQEGFAAFYIYIDQSLTYIYYIMDMLFITPFMIQAIVAFIIFKVTLSLGAVWFKLTFSWIKGFRLF